MLSNCIDGLLTNDSHGNLVANSAKEWYSEDGGKTWTFILADGQTWFDKDGNYKADVVAEDWLYGLEWVLNFAKNDAVNTSMPIEMIQGAKEYYQYTKELYETDPEACMNLGLDKFKEMVGVSAPDDKTLIYTCVDKLAYFPTLATYSCLYPSPASSWRNWVRKATRLLPGKPCGTMAPTPLPALCRATKRC